MSNNKGNFKGLVPLIIFLVLYFAMGIGTGNFDNLPLMVGILIASGIALFLNNKDDKKNFVQKVEIYCRGGGDSTLILMVIIFILAGAFYSVAGEMHAVDTVTNMALGALPANMILPGLFIVGCLLSFSMGTSMGTVAALMPIAIDIAQKTNFNVAIVSGIVVGGAMFGDNLSFISDTTIAATSTQNVAMRDKFRANILMVLPAVVINSILLAFQSIDTSSFTATGEVNYVNLIPYMLVIVLSLIGVHVIPTMTIGIVSGILIGIMHGDFTAVESFGVIHTGMMWMEDMAVIAIFVGGLVALMKYLGGIDWLLNKLTANTKTAKGGELSIAALVSLIDIATTNNTISIIAAGPLARDISRKFGISPARTASILDLFSSAFNGLLPYAGQILVAAGLSGASPIGIMAFNWYSMLMIVFGVVFILIGWPRLKNIKKLEQE